MVRVRLKRTGARNASCFRIVVMHERSSRDGKAIEELGFYDPRNKKENINLERVDYWTSVGAGFSRTVEDIVSRARKGINLADKVKAPGLSKKAKAKAEAAAKEKAEAEVAAKAAAEAEAQAQTEAASDAEA